MPQIKFSGLVTAMKGKAGGSIFSQNKQGAYFRNNRWGGGRKSNRWDAAKNKLSVLSNKWRSLSAEQREAWQAAGANYPFENKFKESYIPSGYQLFMSLNGNLFAHDLPLLNVPGENRPFPDDWSITGGTPPNPWVVKSTGATFPLNIDASSVPCDLGRGCPYGYRCENNKCVPIYEYGSPAFNRMREEIRANYRQYQEPECTNDQDCYDAGLGTGTDIACVDGVCNYVGDGFPMWENTGYVLNVAKALFKDGQWTQADGASKTQVNGTFRFLIGENAMRTLRTTTEEIILVSSYSGDSSGFTIRLVRISDDAVRVYMTLGLIAKDVISKPATFVWYNDFPLSELSSNSVLQFQLNPKNTVQNFLALNNSGFVFGQFSYYVNYFSGPISSWGLPDGTDHNPLSAWLTKGNWTGFVYGPGLVGTTYNVVYNDIRFYAERYTDTKYALSGMLNGLETVLITAAGDVKPQCSYGPCAPENPCKKQKWINCACMAGICGPWDFVAEQFTNKGSITDPSLNLVAAVPIVVPKEQALGGYLFKFAGTWLNLMGGVFQNNGATFVPLTTASIVGTTESGFQFSVIVTRAKTAGTTVRRTEFIKTTLLPADVSAEWELWDFIKPAIASAPPGTEFYVGFDMIDTTTGVKKKGHTPPPRFKAGADLSSSVN